MPKIDETDGSTSGEDDQVSAANENTRIRIHIEDGNMEKSI